MTQAKRDNNHVPTILGVSATDSSTPVPIEADAATKSLKVTIAVNGSKTPCGVVFILGTEKDVMKSA